MAGIFTISLDFEFHWGVFDKRSMESRKKVYENTLALVPRMLALFEEYNVHVTWATVGSMFARNLAEWEKLKPQIQPKYKQMEYSAYSWLENFAEREQWQWALFAPEHVKQIGEYAGQELATHTFSHYYCLEEQYAPEAFEHDLKAVVNAAALYDSKMVSLVFPRNQFNPSYLRTCYRHGIRAVRSNPANWFWKPATDTGSGLIRKIIRTSDAYIQLGGERSSYPLSSIAVREGEPIQLPASRFFRPWRSKYQFANTLRLNHVCAELKSAAIHNECYHLWFHPENFGDHPEENMRSLLQVLKSYRRNQEKYGMISWNMSEYAEHLLHGNSSRTQLQPALSHID